MSPATAARTEANWTNMAPPTPKTRSKDSCSSSSPSPFLTPPHPLSTSRYHRQLLVPSISIRGQEAISKARVLIIGLGGLGSPASLYLAAAGIGTLGLVDADTVECSNLHRQIVHTEESVERGWSKVESAMRGLRGLNSHIRVLGYEVKFAGAVGVGIVRGVVGGRGEKVGMGMGMVEGGYDIVLDCTDNPATRYLISDVCVALGRALVSGAAQRAEGQLMRLCYHPPPPPPPPPHPTATTTASEGSIEEGGGSGGAERGPCYRCVFPTPPAPETVQSCSEIGILGPVVGVIGTLMAMEALKIITTATTTTTATTASRMERREAVEGGGWRPTLLLYNALSSDPKGMFRNVGLRKGARRDCLACADEDVLRQMGRKKITKERIESGEVDYDAFCGRMEDVRVLEGERRVSASEFAERMMKGEDGDSGGGGRRPVVVDVREELEYELGAKVKDSINIPISRILRHGHQVGGDQDPSMEDLLGLSAPHSEEGEEKDDERPIYFLCQRGNDSQIAAKKFLDVVDEGRLGSKSSSRWIGDVVGGFEALHRHEHQDQ